MEFNFIKIANSFNSGISQPMQSSDSVDSTSARAVGHIATVTDSQTVSSTTASQPNHQLFLLPTKESWFRGVVLATVSATVGAAVSAIVTILIGVH